MGCFLEGGYRFLLPPAVCRDENFPASLAISAFTSSLSSSSSSSSYHRVDEKAIFFPVVLIDLHFFLMDAATKCLLQSLATCVSFSAYLHGLR